MKKSLLSNFKFLFILASFIAFISCEKDSPVANGTTQVLNGTLVDSKQNPVPNAIISIENDSKTNQLQSKVVAIDTTDENGNYSIEYKDEDNLAVKVSHSEFKEVKTSLNDFKSKNESNDKKQKMEGKTECQKVLKVLLVDSLQKPITDAKFYLNRGSKLVRKAMSNSNGLVELNEVCAGEFNYRITKEGYNVIEGTLLLKDTDSTSSITHYMAKKNNDETPKDTCCEGKINLIIKNEAGEKLNARIILYKGGKAIADPKAENGVYNFTQLCEGEYKVAVSIEGYKEQFKEFSIKCNDAKEHTFILAKKEETPKDSCCEGKINLIIKNEAGEKLNAKIILYKSGKAIADPKAIDGAYNFTKLCEGEYKVAVSIEGYKEQFKEFSIKCNDEKEHTFILAKKEETPKDSCCEGKINLIIKNEAGEKLNAKIILYKSGKAIADPKAENGVYNFTKLCEGEYKVAVSIEGYKEQFKEFSIKCNDEKEHTFILAKKEETPKDSCCDNRLAIYAKDSKSGESLKDFSIKITRNGVVVREAKASNGKAVIEEICTGNYLVTIMREGYESYSFEQSFTCAKNIEYTKTLVNKSSQSDSCCDARLKFKVYSKDGNKPLANANIKISAGGKVREAKTNADGWVMLEDVCNLNYEVRISLDGYNTLETTWKITACKDWQESFFLTK